MLTPKLYGKLIACIFTGLFVVLVSACGGSGDQSANGVPAPLAENYIDIAAKVGGILPVTVGNIAMLDGSKSSSSSNRPLSYSWSFASRPKGSAAVLQNANTVNPSFTADVWGSYTVQLVVSAEGISSQRAVQFVIATNPGENPTGPFNHLGLSSNCGVCHNGVNPNNKGGLLPHKTPNHIASSNTCQTCHTPLAFALTPFVDHQEVVGNCSECHNGTVAIGKSQFHVETNAECDDCHNTTHFIELNPDGSFDHSNIARACSGCHNGTVSTGKTASTADVPAGTHPVTVSECGYCHTTVSFLNAYPDHTGPDVVGNRCDSCHGAGPALGTSVGHPVTAVDCESCHSIVSFKMPGGIFNHSLLDAAASGQSCESCHNTSTSINATPATNTVTHQTATEDCGWCHNTESFADAIFDHTGVMGDCQTCHGITASGKPLTTPFYAHMPTNPDNPGTVNDQDCGDCHTPGTFSTGTYDHAGVTSGCNACHNNVIGVGKLPNHIPTSPNNQDCAVCHNTTSFADATFDHGSTNTSDCLACHDGNISSGKPAGHISTVLNCSSCHVINNGYSTFANTFTHVQNIVGGNCASCHNTGIATPKKVNHIPAQVECSQCHSDTNTGGFASPAKFLSDVHTGLTSGCEGCHISKFIANTSLVKASSHIPTTQDCDVCHTNNSFTTQIFNHAGITGNCESCHDGNFETPAGALGKTPTHPATNADCGSCHAVGNNFQDGTFDHTGIVDNCAACHGDNPTATPVGPKKNTGHVPTTQDCSVCHVVGTFANAVFDHVGIVDNCVACHAGTGAVGTVKSNGHLPTNEDCSVCHNTEAFAGATFDHQGITNNCVTCHDGVTASGKTPPPNHVPTNQDCSVCHQTTGFIPGTFAHTGIVNNCQTCHDGVFAQGKTNGIHLPTNQDCSVCHTTTSFIGAGFNHTGIVDNCESCHNGSIAIGKEAKTNPVHIATALDCSSCHTTATFVGGTWTHDASSAGNCDQCHNNTGGGATFKPNGHLNTAEQCDVCHTTNGWAPTDFKHSTQGNYPGNHRRDPGCTGCHKGSIGAGINSGNYPNKLQYAPSCAGCHAGDFKSKDKHIGGKNGTVEQNKNCAASGCHKVTSSEF